MSSLLISTSESEDKKHGSRDSRIVSCWRIHLISVYKNNSIYSSSTEGLCGNTKPFHGGTIAFRWCRAALVNHLTGIGILVKADLLHEDAGGSTKLSGNEVGGFAIARGHALSSHHVNGDGTRCYTIADSNNCTNANVYYMTVGDRSLAHPIYLVSNSLSTSYHGTAIDTWPSSDHE